MQDPPVSGFPPGAGNATAFRVFAAAGICAALAALPALAQRGSKPNVLFILADDLGYGDIGVYGQKQVKTPNLDRMAAEGLRFTDFYAGSTVCRPSRSALMTGLHTGHSRHPNNELKPLEPEDLTVAEVLKAAGYTTGMIGKWALGEPGTTGIPSKQGFDHFFGYLSQTHAHNYYPSYLYGTGEVKVPLENVVPDEGAAGQGVATVRVQYSHDLFTEQALQFLDDHKDGPFFLYLAYTIPHANNEGGSKGMEVPDFGDYAGEDWPEAEKGFAAMVSRMDRDVGTLLDRLDQHGIGEKTLVFFSSDNGPHSEGGHDPEFFASNGPLRGIKRDLLEGGVRVPTLARWPGVIRPGRDTDHVGWFPDLLPTLSELAGLEPPDGSDGLSLVPTLLEQPGQEKHEYLYWEFQEGQRDRKAVRQGDGTWKAVFNEGGEALFDLSADLAEGNDVAAGNAAVLTAMKQRRDAAGGSQVTVLQWVPIPLASMTGPAWPKPGIGARAGSGRYGLRTGAAGNRHSYPSGLRDALGAAITGNFRTVGFFRID